MWAGQVQIGATMRGMQRVHAAAGFQHQQHVGWAPYHNAVVVDVDIDSSKFDSLHIPRVIGPVPAESLRPQPLTRRAILCDEGPGVKEFRDGSFEVASAQAQCDCPGAFRRRRGWALDVC